MEILNNEKRMKIIGCFLDNYLKNLLIIVKIILIEVVLNVKIVDKLVYFQ